MAENRPVLNETQSRQGFRDRPVLIVLIASLVLAVVALGVLILPGLI
jgi:hypothetical protein